MIIHMVLFKFEEPVTADFEETVEYHCEQIRQHCEGVILFPVFVIGTPKNTFCRLSVILAVVCPYQAGWFAVVCC